MISSVNINFNSNESSFVITGDQHHTVVYSTNPVEILTTSSNPNIQARKKSLYTYDVKQVFNLIVSTNNGDIQISENKDTNNLVVECEQDPVLQNNELSIVSNIGDISLKIPKNRNERINLHLRSNNGNITTVGNYKLTAGGTIENNNGDINLNIDEKYVYIKNCNVVNGEIINNTSRASMQGLPLEISNGNGNILVRS